jgi:hypothetical protein
MVGHDMSNNRETQPSTTSASTTRPIHSVEALEDAVEAGHRDSNTLISHPQLD